jgi:hypothetical protein
MMLALNAISSVMKKDVTKKGSLINEIRDKSNILRVIVQCDGEFGQGNKNPWV